MNSKEQDFEGFFRLMKTNPRVGNFVLLRVSSLSDSSALMQPKFQLLGVLKAGQLTLGLLAKDVDNMIINGYDIQYRVFDDDMAPTTVVAKNSMEIPPGDAFIDLNNL